jgi:hypothetical protein
MFVEGLGSASVANGVLRIEAFARNGRGEDLHVGDIQIPVNRVTAVIESLTYLVEQVRAQAAEAGPTAE